MKTSPTLPILALGLASAATLLFAACSTTSVTSVSPSAPDPASAIVRVHGSVNRSDPDLNSFAIATETRNRARDSVEDELFEAVRNSLERKGYTYVTDADDADVVVFVNYGISRTIDTPFDSRDLDVVQKRVEVERDPIDGDERVVTTTTTREVGRDDFDDEDALYTSYVDIEAYDQDSLKKEEMWSTHLEGLGWDVDRVHDLALLVRSSSRLIATSTPTVNVELP
ncbi:MAG: hypothetical protein ACREIA_26695 [Opitutaceae bacterium]